MLSDLIAHGHKVQPIAPPRGPLGLHVMATGAGFVIPILGEIMRMPGRPSSPAAERIDIGEDGVITGLS